MLRHKPESDVYIYFLGAWGYESNEGTLFALAFSHSSYTMEVDGEIAITAKQTAEVQYNIITPHLYVITMVFEGRICRSVKLQIRAFNP